MGTWIDSLFAVLMSWVRALVSGIWALFSSENTTVLEFLGKNWLTIAVVMVAVGLVVDWLIYLVRWQPYHIWAQRVRRILRIADEEEEDGEDAQEAAMRAYADFGADQAYAQPQQNELDELDEEEAPLAEPELFIDEQQAQEVVDRANEVPDDALGAYPGMRYDAAGAQGDLSGTRRFSAIAAQGPGSEEVARRRAEIDAWKQQMLEERQAQLRAEREAKEAKEAAEAARMAEAERLAREAKEAEEAAEAARLAEEERLAQAQYEEYERQMAQYALEKARYERELAEYERQKAEYDAQMAAARRQAAEEIAGEIAAPRRRRAAKTAYSDGADGEEISELPPPPAWPQAAKAVAQTREKPKNEKPAREHKLLDRMAKMIEEDEEELTSFRALPPRVDVHDAYKPAKKPEKPGRRRR